MTENEEKEVSRLQSFADLGSKVFLFIGVAFLVLKVVPQVARWIISFTGGAERQIKAVAQEKLPDGSAVSSITSSSTAPERNEK